MSGSVRRVKTIGENVRAQRQSRNLSQTGLADALGGDWVQKTVSRIENGQDMTVTQLEQLIRVLSPQILAETNLGVMASADFVYLLNESRIAESREYLHEAYQATEHTLNMLRGIGKALE